jgi:hypothetical protein
MCRKSDPTYALLSLQFASFNLDEMRGAYLSGIKIYGGWPQNQDTIIYTSL